MKELYALFLLAFFFTHHFVSAQHGQDSTMLSRLREAGRDDSKVMEVLSMLTDVNGPRLTNSPGYVTAAQYVKRTLESWGMTNVHFDVWDESFGRGWQLKKFSLDQVRPTYTPLIAYPKAWSPGIKRTIKADVVYLDIRGESDVEKYRGKLKGKIVLFNLLEPRGPSFKADAWRHADSVIREMAGARPSAAYRGRRFSPPFGPQRLAWMKWDLCQREGAVAVIEPSSRLEDDGTMVVSAATVPYPAETSHARRLQPWHPDTPEILPQIVMAVEHYNRLVRQVQKGIKVSLQLTLQIEFTAPLPGFNVIGEIAGSDLSDQVIMIGAHLDSWHSGTGATDNAAGSAVMMEAMRLIRGLSMQPRRTIRIALWGGEEQGLLGSRSYARRKLGERLDHRYPYDSIRLTSAAENFSVYFNMDYGAGKYRGIYLQGNEAAVPMFEEWLSPFRASGGGTISLRNATGTDHLSFDALGLPAYQFIQDPLEYATRTYHANMDVYDKVVEEDLKYNAVMTAYLAWRAANAEELVPRDRNR